MILKKQEVYGLKYLPQKQILAEPLALSKLA